MVFKKLCQNMHYIPVEISVATLSAYYTPSLTPSYGSLWTHMAFSADLCFELKGMFITSVGSISPQWTPKHAGSQNCVLLHDLCCRVCESQVSHMNGNAAVMLHFVLQHRHTYPVRKLSQRFSWRSPIEHHLQTVYPQTASVFYIFSCHLKYKLLLKNFSNICMLFYHIKLAHWETFILTQNDNFHLDSE